MRSGATAMITVTITVDRRELTGSALGDTYDTNNDERIVTGRRLAGSRAGAYSRGHDHQGRAARAIITLYFAS